jgi:class 3 adenylate cyclase/tetratricopeptide (TPR) repeat protein
VGVDCPTCQTENRAEARFCRACGGALALTCPSCHASVAAEQSFCDECGHDLTVAEPAREPERTAERRLVSVLFADLVGFTALSESRDPEEVRELLSRYFETCRRLVERYGGVVEKFIGDAVMAVWGTTANEDDAERAVRTGLDLVAAVSSLADELGADDLHLRVGVLTGEAAVTLGAQGEGMVAGDLVNTASRIQSLAEPGTVVVGDTTRRATEAAIAYEDIGFHPLKGKTEPVRLHRARRVIAARRGEGRSAGLEAPFVGREREFRLVKDLFHASADEGRARLVSIIGVAGVGKSRLGWEFEKYTDGLADDVYWHRGRCLAYGEGVAYWALAEMVRMRARISEEEGADTALPKLREALAGFVPDVEERAFLEPRLAHLLGLAERSAPDKEDLFSAWRLFFERMAGAQPVVLVFEDLQWADAGLLDFIEYLLDWARDHPIYVLSFARPELAERRAAWGAGRRDFTSLYLEPLRPDDVGALLDGLVPGLPDELRERVVAQADGVPLYAVETVRMLLDRRLLRKDGAEYRPAGLIETLAIPETLQSLAAARLDSLPPDERHVVEDAAVLGRTFTRQGLAAVSGKSEEDVEPHLQSLIRKELLVRQLDPLSPEQHQLAFPQDLVRRVAYETLSARDRKTRHLAAAAFLEREGDDDIAAVVAAHYLDAYRLGTKDADAAELRAKAGVCLLRAGERASSLASAGEACRYFAHAAELEDDDAVRSNLFEQAGMEAGRDGQFARAHELLQQAIDLHEARNEEHAAARVAARRAEFLRSEDRISEALELMETAYRALAGKGTDPDTALVAAQLARIAYFAGERARALEAVEIALDMGEALRLPEVIAEALTSRATLLYHRPHEATALLQEAINVARENELPTAQLRAQFNLSGAHIEQDRLADAAAVLEDALAYARRRGDRTWESAARGQLGEVLVMMGDWPRAWVLLEDVALDRGPAMVESIQMAPVHTMLVWRGELDLATALLDRMSGLATSTDLQTQAVFLVAHGDLLRALGRPQEGLAEIVRGVKLWRELYQPHYAIDGYGRAFDAALEDDDVEGARRILHDIESLEPIERRRFGYAHAHRMRANLEARGGQDPHENFAAAERLFREIGALYQLAVVLAEHAEHGGDGAEEARRLFEHMGATPWLERLAGLPV